MLSNMSLSTPVDALNDEMSTMCVEEEFCWQAPHGSFPLAQELTDLISASDRYFVSTLDPFNPGKSLIRDVMNMLDGGQTVPGEFVVELLNKSIAEHELLPNVIQVQRSRFQLDDDIQSHVNAADMTAYSGGVTVVGDLHGQYFDFANLLRNPDFGGFPSAFNRFILNGDMVDRGLFSVEIIVVATLIKLFYPEDMHLLRGNHESLDMNVSHGFHEELNRKYPGNILLRCLFAKLFNALPVAAVIEGQVFVAHGGLGAKISTMTIEEINKLNRFQEPWKCQPLYELMWSDPSIKPGFTGSARGPNIVCFGPDVTKSFLARNNLQWMIRSHEHCDEGYDKQHDGLCWTVFSAPNYCGKYTNLGAVISFSDLFTMDPAVIHMLPVHYPPVAPPIAAPAVPVVPVVPVVVPVAPPLAPDTPRSITDVDTVAASAAVELIATSAVVRLSPRRVRSSEVFGVAVDASRAPATATGASARLTLRRTRSFGVLEIDNSGFEDSTMTARFSPRRRVKASAVFDMLVEEGPAVAEGADAMVVEDEQMR